MGVWLGVVVFVDIEDLQELEGVVLARLVGVIAILALHYGILWMIITNN